MLDCDCQQLYLPNLSWESIRLRWDRKGSAAGNVNKLSSSALQLDLLLPTKNFVHLSAIIQSVPILYN